MFQNNPDLRRSFLKVGALSVITGLPLAFTIRGSWFTNYMLMVLPFISLFMLLVFGQIIKIKNRKLSVYEKKESKLALHFAILFLAINCFLVGGIGNLIFRYDEYAAIKYCEQVVGKKAEEYKTLNGVYPNRNILKLDEAHKPLMVTLWYADGYSSSEDSASCEYKYPKESSKAYKVYIIQDKKWVERSGR